MADYEYVASGSLHLLKCGVWYSMDPIYTRGINFSIGDQVWLRHKAVRGVLESIVIKKIRLVDQSYKGAGQVYVLYVDTRNALYNESDLVDYATAITLVENYFAQRRAAEAAADCLR